MSARAWPRVFRQTGCIKTEASVGPTIIYGLSAVGTLGRPILRTEIQQMTPYNTYTMKAFRRLPSPIPVGRLGGRIAPGEDR